MMKMLSIPGAWVGFKCELQKRLPSVWVLGTHWIKRSVPALSLALAGCVSNYAFKVDAINNPGIQAGDLRSCRIINENKPTELSDVPFQDAAAYLKTALSGMGFYEAPDRNRAGMIIGLSYGLGPPRIGFKRILTSSIHDQLEEREEYIAVTVYEKYMRVTCKANQNVKPGEKPPELWSILIKSTDQNNDLRKYLPLMTAASLPFLGRATEHQVKVTLKEKDDAVIFVKKGM